MKPPEVGGRTLKKAAEAAALEAQNEGKEGGRQTTGYLTVLSQGCLWIG